MSDSIKIFFAGDFCSKPSTKNITVDEDLKKIIADCDISVVNFEVPLKPSVDLPNDGYERFFQNDDAPDFLKGLGFNLFSIANNHMFDWGDEGFLRVKEAFGDSAFGAGTYDEAYKIKVVEVKGNRIGFLALCYGSRRGVFNDVLNKNKLGCAHLFDLKVNHIIADAHKDVDYLFVLPHAGIEYVDIPMPEIIALYRDFIDWGADGVIGSHPHCPQGWETYKNKPIFYSLGNFFFNSKPVVDYVAKRPHWYEGIAVLAEITKESIIVSVINTHNINNRELVKDHNNERNKFGEYLCNLLKDREAYDVYLKKMIAQKSSNMLRTISLGVLFSSFKEIVKLNINYVVSILRRMNGNKLQAVKSMVNDEVSMSIIKRITNNK